MYNRIERLLKVKKKQHTRDIISLRIFCYVVNYFNTIMYFPLYTFHLKIRFDPLKVFNIKKFINRSAVQVDAILYTYI